MICVVCSKDQTDRVCRRCKKSMASQLKDIRTAHHDASFYLLPERRGERSSERGLGVRLDALDFLANFDVLPVLEEWERDWRRFFELSPYGEASSLRLREAMKSEDAFSIQVIELVSCVRFLEDWLPRACESYEPMDEFALELRALWRKAQTAAGRTQRTAWRVTCPTDTDKGECGTALRISGEDFDKPLYCKSCGTSWKVERLLMVVASSKHAEVWLDPEAAATWFGLPVRELRRLAQRGLIRRSHGRYESHSIREAILSGGRS